MARLERLVNLSAALLAADRALTAEELRERVPGYPDEKSSFRRQFERDKDALRELGIPLQTVTLPNDSQAAYRVEFDEYYVKDPGLAPDELAALHLAARVVRMGDLSETDHAIWKLGPEVAAAPEATGDETSAQLPGGANVATVFEAIATGRVLQFQYRGDARRVVARRLSFRNGHWYVAAFDLERSDDRSFRIDRFEGRATVGAAADLPDNHRPADQGLRGWEIGDGAAVATRLHIDRGQAPWAVTHLGEASVVDRDTDGGVTVEMTVRNVDAFRSFALGFLDHGEVISPRVIRDDMIDWLRMVAAVGPDGAR